MSNHLPLIVILTTGGTIASRIDAESGAVRAVASPEELVSMVPELAGVARIELKPWVSVNSWNMTPAMMFDVVQEARSVLARPDVAGIVITHGTDTVEESGLMADLLIESDKPVVFVTAMRNLSEPSPDGPRNLLDAVRVASSAGSRGRGALVVANEKIHAARYVVKTDTVHQDTFLSPDYGPVGMIPPTGLRYLHSSPERRTLSTERLAEPVHIIKAVSGSDSSMIHWLLDEGTRGIVLEGSGAGNVPSGMMESIERAIESNIPVVLTSRTVWGFLSGTYGSGGPSGGGFDLMRVGVIPAPHLSAPKGRIALMVALGAGLSHSDIRKLLA